MATQIGINVKFKLGPQRKVATVLLGTCFIKKKLLTKASIEGNIAGFTRVDDKTFWYDGRWHTAIGFIEFYTNCMQATLSLVSVDCVK